MLKFEIMSRIIDYFNGLIILFAKLEKYLAYLPHINIAHDFAFLCVDIIRENIQDYTIIINEIQKT